MVTVLVFAASEMALSEIAAQRLKNRALAESRDHLLVMTQQLLIADSVESNALVRPGPEQLRIFENASELATGEYHAMAAQLLPQFPELRTTTERVGRLLAKRLEELRLAIHLATHDDIEHAASLPARSSSQALLEEFRHATGTLDQNFTATYEQSFERVSDLLVKRRIGTSILVALNLLFLIILGMQTHRHLRFLEDRRRLLADHARQLEQAVKQRTRELAQLNTYLQHRVEKERAGLARELHDKFGALLTAAKMDVAWLQGRNQNQDSAHTQRLSHLSDVLDSAVDLKRSVTETLHPSLLDHLGLAAALQWYVEQTCQPKGIPFRIALSDIQMADDLALALYRVAQETVGGVMQSQRPECITVSLQESREHIVLEILVKGLPAPASAHTELPSGLAGLQQRLVKNAAVLTHTRNAAEGLKVIVTVPKAV